MIPERLRPDDEVRVASPAVSLGFIPEDQKSMARERLEGLGLRLSFSRNTEVMDRFDSSPVEARVSDLHEAFADPEVKGILTTLGGYNSNGLLGYPLRPEAAISSTNLASRECGAKYSGSSRGLPIWIRIP